MVFLVINIENYYLRLRMQILTLPFEESFYITIGNDKVKIITFTTSDPLIIKFGIDASRNISIHREEIYESIQNQQKLDSSK